VKTAAKAQLEPRKSRADDHLIALCRKGDEQAWADLVDKYKNLVYSIPIKLGMYDDAGDIFQSVFLELLTELPKLREARALPKWLMQVCYHRCLHYRTTAKRQVQFNEEDEERLPIQGAEQQIPEDMLVQLQREQLIRNVIHDLPNRCQRMIRMLFYETPPRPYQQVAKELSIAAGSIGFIRGRCLARMQKQLEKMGFS
jgi:RNA polymerase sigma factor (sigma-70 family)